MKQIKTIKRKRPKTFDREVNAALAEDWSLVSLYERGGWFFAGLEKEVKKEMTSLGRWQLAEKYKLLPFVCNKCGFKASKAYTIRPSCHTEMSE